MKLSKYQQIFFIILGMLVAETNVVKASELNAGFVMNKMSADEQVSYVAGVVEGLAYSRYLRDKPDQSGMKCVYDWYAGENVTRQVDQWFKRHPDKPVGVLLHVLIKKECGA
ncbi:MAG: hypothetical protein GY761_04010 [Hyphomicrobiales bacterium]|nr:hypothetical protein [Hyphomicrobiales bacterium]